MKISCYTKHGPLNSKPVFDAFIKSIKQAGDTVEINEDNNCDATIIWSVLWQGRMMHYRPIWENYRNKNKPVIVLEVGGIKRNETWKIGINGINREADFANQEVDNDRWKKFNIDLHPWKQNGDNIIICGQHHNSHQWRNNKAMHRYIPDQINEIRKHTDRPIVIRPHPRNNFHIDVTKYKSVKFVNPVRDRDTYDDTDFTTQLNTAWAVVNYSSNPAIQSVFRGVPVFVSTASLCFEVGNKKLRNINSPVMPDRSEWINKLAYTEWWIDEIEKGLPWARIKKRLKEKYV